MKKMLPWLMLLALLCVPWGARAQDNSVGPPNAGDSADGPLIAGQAEPGPPPPMAVRKSIITAGPGDEGFMQMGGMKRGDGLGAWWKNSDIASKLQLSDDQIKKISQTYLDHKLKLIDLQADVEKQSVRLEPLMDADHPDPAKVGEQMDLVSAARGKLEKEFVMMLLAIRNNLSPQQWQKLQSIESAEKSKRVMLFRTNGPMDGPPPPGPMPAPAPPR